MIRQGLQYILATHGVTVASDCDQASDIIVLGGDGEGENVSIARRGLPISSLASSCSQAGEELCRSGSAGG